MLGFGIKVQNFASCAGRACADHRWGPNKSTLVSGQVQLAVLTLAGGLGSVTGGVAADRTAANLTVPSQPLAYFANGEVRDDLM
jgi:hypothetical protein